MRIVVTTSLLLSHCALGDSSRDEPVDDAGRAFHVAEVLTGTTVQPLQPQPGPLAAASPTLPDAPTGPCPPEMVLAGRVCVDRYEAHLLLEGRIHPHHERPREGVRYVAASAPGVFPQAYVSRVEAADACAAAGKRLCSRTEWTAACRGTQPTACNRGKAPLLPLLFPEAGWSFSYAEHFNSAAPSLVAGFLAHTGESSECKSEAGAHDMVGNLHEWVSDPVTRAFIAAFEQEMPRQWQPAVPGNGIFMGGFYSTTSEHGPGCAFTTVAHDPGYHDYSTGFRCCAERH